MQANVLITVHGIAALDAVKLAELTQELGISFSARPTVILDKSSMECRLTTQNVSRLVRVVEALTVTVALRYSPHLWLSVAAEYADQEAPA
jgi:hypothetical protein